MLKFEWVLTLFDYWTELQQEDPNHGVVSARSNKLINSFSETKQLRLSYDLCDEEKNFLQKRKAEILKHMPRILDENTAPKTVEEVGL